MSKHLALGCVCVASLALAGGSQAFEFEVGDSYISVGGYVKNETAVFTRGGQVTGSAKSTVDTSKDHSSFDLLKFENSARFFLNGDIGEESSWHGDINVIANTEGVNDDYQWHRSYTQHDWLRELYIDTRFSGWDLRLGKQQVVWGTADGIKLLDIINPTDWREFNQNTMEDSRIPVWMLNAERNVGDSGNIQFIVAQNEESKISGLNKDGDAGHPFIFKGVDTITGQVNGFRHIAPVLGSVAATFDSFVAPGGPFNAFFNSLNIGSIATTRVEDFVNGNSNPAQQGATFVGGACQGQMGVTALINQPGGNAACLNRLAQIQGNISTTSTIQGGANNQVTNTIDGGTPIAQGATPTAADNAFWDTANPNSAFEYFPDAAFGTFDSFVGLKTSYRRDYPDELEPNFGTRFRWTTDGGTNISINYLYGYDPNPSVSVHYEDTRGQRLTSFVGDGTTANPAGVVNGQNVITLHDSGGAKRCSASGARASTSDTGCTLVFEETLHRVHNIGTSFDTSLDVADHPLVLRGEFIYQKDVRVPVIDRGEMAIGNLPGSFKAEKADFVKYVVGLDGNAFTNLFVSLQFIQFINLDFVDEASSRNSAITTARTTNGVTPTAVDYRRYTGHLPTLHLDNGLNAGEEYENYISFFLSKPFGPSQEHRWNNIIIREERGGWWNRFDFEYTFSDELIGSFEWNHYWGKENSLFGQFDKSSNLQVGLKYIF